MKTLISILLGLIILGASVVSRPQISIAPSSYQANDCDSFFMDLAKNWRYDTKEHLYIPSSAFEKWDYRNCFDGFSQKDILQCLGEPSLVSLDSQIFCYNTFEFYGSENRFRLKKKIDIHNPYYQSATSCEQIRFFFDKTKKSNSMDLGHMNRKNLYNIYDTILLTENNYQAKIKTHWSYNEELKSYIWTGDMFSSHLDMDTRSHKFGEVELKKEDVIYLFGNPTLQNDSLLFYKVYSDFRLLGLDAYKGSSGSWRIRINPKSQNIISWSFQIDVNVIMEESDYLRY